MFTCVTNTYFIFLCNCFLEFTHLLVSGLNNEFYFYMRKNYFFSILFILGFSTTAFLPSDVSLRGTDKKPTDCQLSVKVLEGEKVTFNKKGTLHAEANEPNTTYIWAKNGKEISRTRIIMVTESGFYTVVVMNRAGCDESFHVKVTINNEDLQVRIQEETYAQFKNIGVLHSECNQTSEVKYEWWKDNRIISNKKNLVVTEGGMYRVVASTEGGRQAISKVTGVSMTYAPKTYKVRSGDDLQRIADKFYDDPDKWLLIYEANKKVIKNQEILRAGIELTIPEDQEVDYASLRTLRIASGNAFPPFTDKRLYKNGMTNEMVEKIFDEMGQSIEIKEMSWTHAQNIVHTGGYQAAFPFVKNKEREEAYYFSLPLHKILSVWFVRADSKITKPTEVQFEGKIIAKPEGYHLHDIEAFLEDGTLILETYPTIYDCFDRLYKGYVDIVATGQMNGLGIIREMKEMKTEDFRILEEPIGVNTLHFIVSKKVPGSQALMYKFNRTYERLQVQGAIKEIKDLHIDIYQMISDN